MQAFPEGQGERTDWPHLPYSSYNLLIIHTSSPPNHPPLMSQMWLSPSLEPMPSLWSRVLQLQWPALLHSPLQTTHEIPSSHPWCQSLISQEHQSQITPKQQDLLEPPWLPTQAQQQAWAFIPLAEASTPTIATAKTHQMIAPTVHPTAPQWNRWSSTPYNQDSTKLAPEPCSLKVWAHPSQRKEPSW